MSYNINVSVGRDCGCEISDNEFAHYLAACESAISAAYPDASVSVVEHDGSGTRVGNSRPWADDDSDINDACNGIAQEVWEQCCADSFGAGPSDLDNQEMAMEAARLAQQRVAAT